MVNFIFANDALSSLAGSISNVATTLAVQAGAGALFPNPAGGQQFALTLIDASTGLLKEIVYVTARTGDTMTVIRGREGTTALNWSANDPASELMTAGQCGAFVQTGQLQIQSGNYAVDTGAANAYLVTLNPAIGSAPVSSFTIRVWISHNNTGASTLNAGWGAAAVVRRNGSACIGNEILANTIQEFLWDPVASRWQLPAIAPATNAVTAAGTDTQSAVTPASLASVLTNPGLPSGQCYLSYVGSTSIKLSPFNGNRVPVNGNPVVLPSGGVTVANSGISINGTGGQTLSASTTYYVALGASGALEFWTFGTGYTISNGIAVIVGHQDKTVVGKIATNASGNFVDTDGALQVISWFNRKTKKSRTAFTGNPTFSSTTPGELDTSIRNTFLCWNGDAVEYRVAGTVYCGASGQLAMTGVGFDTGVAPEREATVYSGMHTNTEGSSTTGSTALASTRAGLDDSLHYATLIGASSGGTGQWQGGDYVFGGSNPPPNYLVIEVQG